MKCKTTMSVSLESHVHNFRDQVIYNSNTMFNQNKILLLSKGLRSSPFLNKKASNMLSKILIVQILRSKPPCNRSLL